MFAVGVNALAILVCAVVGKFLGNIFTDELKEIIYKALGLVILLIGIQMALQGLTDMSVGALGRASSVLLVLSLVLGSIVGAYLHLQEGMYNLGLFFERTLHKILPAKHKNNADDGSPSFATGFVSASVFFCAGAIGVLGSIQAGLGDNSTLYLKAALDGATALIFAATLGWGVTASAISVLVYQGVIVLFAGLLSPLISSEMLAGIGGVGGVMIMALGLNMLGYKEIPVIPMLPSIIFIVVAAYFL